MPTATPPSPRSPPVPASRFACALALLIPGALMAGGPVPPSLPQVEIGRGIYERGVLPDGTPLRANHPGGAVLEGPPAACATCHRRSGFGTFEGTLLVPPVTAAVLFAPAPHYIVAGATPTGAAASVPWYRAMTRSAYDEATLVRALRDGVDPDGDPLLTPMPRYDLDAGAAAGLVAYLRQLSALQSPGIEADTLHLAVVVTPDAPPGAAEAVLGVLQAWVANPSAEMRWQLHVWPLSGPAEGWQAQLDARYREQPVFALLSGAGGGDWAPIHRFCEQAEVACVLPSVDLAPEQAGDVYSLYFSPGVALEARLLARHLNITGTGTGGGRHIVQVYADAAGQGAAQELRANLGAGAGMVSERKFRRIAPLAGLDDLSADDVLILWLRPLEVAALVAQAPQGPPASQIYLSALLAPPAALSLPPGWKARTGFVSLFDVGGGHGAIARRWLEAWLQRAGLPKTGDLRRQADAYGAAHSFTLAFAQMQRQRSLWRGTTLNRIGLLENLESVVTKDVGNPMDINAYVPFYARLSLASGQRIAAKGGRILRYASPDSWVLVPIDAQVGAAGPP